MEEGTVQPLLLLKQYGLVIGLFLIGLVVFMYGLIQFMHKPSVEDVTFQTSDQPVATGTISPTQISEIVVDIEGAVVRPGVYHLESTARLQDLITKSGGLSRTVDHEKVAKGLNLAEKLSDGMKIYIPFLGEDLTASVGQQTPIQSGQTVLGASTRSSGLININTASTEELDSLPGVGSVTASKIISSRPYSHPEDLVTKKAVGQATYEKLKDKITVQ